MLKDVLSTYRLISKDFKCYMTFDPVIPFLGTCL